MRGSAVSPAAGALIGDAAVPRTAGPPNADSADGVAGDTSGRECVRGELLGLVLWEESDAQAESGVTVGGARTTASGSGGSP